MPNLDHETIELAFIVVTGLAVLVQTVVLIVMAVSSAKALGAMKEEVEELRASVVPIVADTKQLMAKLTPRFEATARDISDVARDLKEISAGLKVQVKEVEATAAEVVDRLRRQTGRVDAMITSALDGVDRAGEFVATVVQKPVRQATAVLAGAKAIVESLRESRPSSRQSYRSEEPESFI